MTSSPSQNSQFMPGSNDFVFTIIIVATFYYRNDFSFFLITKNIFNGNRGWISAELHTEDLYLLLGTLVQARTCHSTTASHWCNDFLYFLIAQNISTEEARTLLNFTHHGSEPRRSQNSS